MENKKCDKLPGLRHNFAVDVDPGSSFIYRIEQSPHLKPEHLRTKMPSTRQILAALVAGVATANAANGPYFSTGPTSSSTYIKESTATLILPAAPSNNKGDLSLWVGMGTSAGDLIQSIADCYVRCAALAIFSDIALGFSHRTLWFDPSLTF